MSAGLHAGQHSHFIHVPTLDETTRLARLRGMLWEEISNAGGAIPFFRFMELALYYPGLGYYETTPDRVGRTGDFITSVSVGPLFGELLALQFVQWSRTLGESQVQWVEAGAHDGRLAADILGWIWEHRPDWRDRILYKICEPSPVRRGWQQSRLTPFAGHVEWVDTVPETTGLILSNELLDAFPIERFGWDAAKQSWYRQGVTASGPEAPFRWCRLPGRSADFPVRSDLGMEPRQAALIDGPPSLPPELLAVLPDGYVWESSPLAGRWWSGAASALRRGWLFTCDYGLTESESFSPARARGTLRGYRNHRHVDDVLAEPGSTDLTAHVNFSRLEGAGVAAGLSSHPVTGQAQFLTRIMRDAVTSGAAFGEWTPARTRQFQTLTHPEHLGRSFRVLVQERSADFPVRTSKVAQG